MKFVTKYCKVYELNFDGFIQKVNSLPSHLFLSKMSHFYDVPLDRVRVKFKGFVQVLVPLFLFESDNLPF